MCLKSPVPHKPWLNIFVYAFLLLVCLCDKVSAPNLVMSKERILSFLPAGFWCLNKGLKAYCQQYKYWLLCQIGTYLLVGKYMMGPSIYKLNPIWCPLAHSHTSPILLQFAAQFFFFLLSMVIFTFINVSHLLPPLRVPDFPGGTVFFHCAPDLFKQNNTYYLT